MGHRQAKKIRVAVYGHGSGAQSKKHTTEYAERNPARPRRVELGYNEYFDIKSPSLMDRIRGLGAFAKEKFERTLFFPEGTRGCTGLRKIYHNLKRGV
jgi:hypothetical protein